jgi:hypothetical protein
VLCARVGEENGKMFALIPLSPNNPAMKIPAIRKYRVAVVGYLSGLLLSSNGAAVRRGGRAIDPPGER